VTPERVVPKDIVFPGGDKVAIKAPQYKWDGKPMKCFLEISIGGTVAGRIIIEVRNFCVHPALDADPQLDQVCAGTNIEAARKSLFDVKLLRFFRPS